MKRFSSIIYYLFGFLGLGILTIGILFISSLTYNTQARDLLAVIKQDTQFLNQVKEIRYHFSFARKEEKNWLLFKNPSYLDSRRKSLTRGHSLLVDLRQKMNTPESVEMLESLESSLLHYMALGEELKGLDSIRKIDSFTQKVKVIDEAVTEGVNDVTDLLLLSVTKSQETAARNFELFFWWSIISLFLGVGLFIGLGVLLAYRFRSRLARLTYATRKMALGDYSPQLDASSSDELGILASNFNEMASKIAEREEKINQITQELIQANNLLKKGTTPIHQIPKIRI